MAQKVKSMSCKLIPEFHLKDCDKDGEENGLRRPPHTSHLHTYAGAHTRPHLHRAHTIMRNHFKIKKHKRYRRRHAHEDPRKHAYTCTHQQARKSLLVSAWVWEPGTEKESLKLQVSE